MTITQTYRAGLAVLITSTMLFLAACGSGTSTSGSGSGGGAGLASISGNVSGGVAMDQARDQSALLARILTIALEEAHAAGVSGVTVSLLLAGAEVASQTTDDSGEFRFTGLLPGNYTIQLFQSGGQVGSETSVSLAADTDTRLELDVSGAVLNLDVQAMGRSDIRRSRRRNQRRRQFGRQLQR